MKRSSDKGGEHRGQGPPVRLHFTSMGCTKNTEGWIHLGSLRVCQAFLHAAVGLVAAVPGLRARQLAHSRLHRPGRRIGRRSRRVARLGRARHLQEKPSEARRSGRWCCRQS